jgi:hypothetical protein
VRITGKYLNGLYGINAKCRRYRETGDWFGRIEEFPATLWDGPPYGYVRFENLENCSGVTVHPSGQITASKELGIGAVAGYVRVRQRKVALEIEL